MHGTGGGMSYGNQIQAKTRSLIVLGKNKPTMMIARPEITNETDRTVSGHPTRLCSKHLNSLFTDPLVAVSLRFDATNNS
jgi:hypothetical protein